METIIYSLKKRETYLFIPTLVSITRAKWLGNKTKQNKAKKTKTKQNKPSQNKTKQTKNPQNNNNNNKNEEHQAV